MLAKFYRFIVVNNSGSTITYDTNGRLNMKMTGVIVTPSTGKLAYTPLDDDDLDFDAGRSIIDGEEVTDEPSLVATAEIDNSSNLYVNLQIQLEVTHDEGAAADGTFDIYLEMGDATGDLASDASGYTSAEANKLRFIGSLTWEPNASDDDVIRSPVFTI